MRVVEQVTAVDNTVTIFYEEGERVYPCRCGKTHKGDYAIYDFGHHNCFHESKLLGLPFDQNTIQAICPDCGKSWMVGLNN